MSIVFFAYSKALNLSYIPEVLYLPDLSILFFSDLCYETLTSMAYQLKCLKKELLFIKLVLG